MKPLVNRDNTLTVAHLLKALADGRISPDMPIGVVVCGETKVLGVVAHELHTYKDGTVVFVAHTEVTHRPVSDDVGETSAEVGL
jgi:hypothetical protein